MTAVSPPDDARTAPLYSPAEAARLAGTTTATVLRWFCGSETSPALFSDRQRQTAEAIHLSFLELVEVIVVRRFRQHGVSVEQLHQSRESARKRWQVEYPFAERRLKLLGGRVLDPEGIAIDIEWPSTQPALPKLAKFATQVFDYEELDRGDASAAWAQRFFPAGESAPLVVDPRFAGGAVTFINRGLLLDTVVQRWRAEEPIAFIAADFGLEEASVEAALRYALAA